MQKNRFLLLICLFISVKCDSYDIQLTSDAPGVLGAPLTFRAKVYTNEELEDSDFTFKWRDNGIPGHRWSLRTNVSHSEWTISYPSEEGYVPGKYIVEIQVYKRFIIEYFIGSKRLEFEVTGLLNGALMLYQNNTIRTDEYISSESPLNQTIQINQTDYNFLMKNATSVTIYWFIDCVYTGMSTNYTLINEYTKLDRKYDIEALVVASFEPLPTTTTIPPTTTTPMSTTNSINTTTTTTTTPATIPKIMATSSTDLKNISHNNSTIDKHVKRKRRDVESIDTTTVFPLNTIYPTTNDDNLVSSNLGIFVADQQPFVCFNKSAVAPDPKKIYGYFHRQVIVKHSIANVSISGNNWLQKGEMLNLQIKCSGSPPYNYCYKTYNHPYNMTGNETCQDYMELNLCDFGIIHYYSTVHTIVIILVNQVSVVHKAVTINFYDVQNQSQLSVIVVPVAFSLVAVILVIFGVAYYIQNRSRFAVEVADFNFGETMSVDMEYKTFHQRLFDSVRTFVSRPADVSGSESSLKYGSMT